MTTTQLAAMQAGKREADAVRRVKQHEQLVVYKAWVKAEAAAHAFMVNTELLHGRIACPEFNAARQVWLDTWRDRPASPPAGAWEALRDTGTSFDAAS